MKSTSLSLFFILYVLFFFTAIDAKSQNLKTLNYNCFYADCENKYVIISSGTDSTKFLIGFVYLDATAGFTLHAEVNVYTDAEGNFKSKDNSPAFTVLKLRLGKNTQSLALLPNELQKKFELKEEPQWLGIYKIADPVLHDITSASHLNGQGYYEKAILLLEKHQTHKPRSEKLEFELSFSYNAIGQYNKAIVLLENAILSSKNNALLYKELGFAYKNAGKIKDAITALKKGVSVAADNQKLIKTEMAFNIAILYKQNLNDEQEFQNWGKKAYDWSPATSVLSKALVMSGLKVVERADTARLDANNNIVFNDKVLEGLLRKELSISSEKPISKSDVENLTFLNISGNFKDKSIPKIKNIDALKYFVNLHKLTAKYHSIKDLNPLRNLTNLTVLSLQNNEIVSIEPLSKLTNLVELDIYFNNVSDLSPIKDLKGMKHLNLFSNNFYNIDALASLNNLEFINLGSNYISDISPLLKLSKLQTLWLYNNSIRNIDKIEALSSTIKVLSLAKCGLKDIAFLQNFTKLESLMIFDNAIDDLSPIKQLTTLQVLIANKCSITDLSVIVALIKNNSFQIQRESFQCQVDLSGNPIDYTNTKINEDKIFLMQKISKLKF